MQRQARWLSILIFALGVALVATAVPADAVKDRSPPTIYYLNVGPLFAGPEGFMGIAVRATDNVGVKTLTASIIGPAPSVGVIGTVDLFLTDGDPQDGLWNGTFQFPSGAAEGSYDATVVATDAARNSASMTGGSTFLDTTPPAIVGADNPAFAGPYEGFYIREAVADNVGVSSVAASFVGPSPATTVVGTTGLYMYYGDPQFGNWTGYFLFPGADVAPEGTYAIVSTAWDVVGNTVSRASGSLYLDRTPPETLILSAVDAKGALVTDGGGTKSSTITFTFEGIDVTGIQAFLCSLDGAPFNWCYTPLTYTRLSPGGHTFQVYALDNVGLSDPTPATFSWRVRH